MFRSLRTFFSSCWKKSDRISCLVTLGDAEELSVNRANEGAEITPEIRQ